MRPTSLAILLTLTACGPSLPADDDDDVPTPADASILPGVVDGPMTPMPDGKIGTAYDDANVRPEWDGGTCDIATCASPVPGGCGDTEVCNDGLDNDCDLSVDEGCLCPEAGAVKPCFLGPPGLRGVGACQDGHQRCDRVGEVTGWSVCEGGISPSAEQCDGQDNDCNGCVDDDPQCCEPVSLACPGPGTIPEIAPFDDLTLDGTTFYNGSVTMWRWTVEGGPCDKLFKTTTGSPPKQSFTLTGANTSRLIFKPTLSGDYTVTVTITTPSGTFTCTFIVHVKGPGLRVELCWDKTGSTDIDLHLHKPDSTAAWFGDGCNSNGSCNSYHVEDCYFADCAAALDYAPPTRASWGYSPSPLANCVKGRPEWATETGNCPNPRLDIDNINSVGVPENINVDVPEDRKAYRVMVHYYGGPGLFPPAVHPIVNIYCGGYLKGTYGAAPNRLSGFNAPGGNADGLMWRVVDISPLVSGDVTTDCDLRPLHPSGSTDYLITNGNLGYSPP